MSLFHLLLLALIQGLTEFLPVSSSAHLILLPALTGAEDQGLAMDVAVHVGTLAAVMLFFRRDVAKAARGTVHLLRGNTASDDARLALLLIIATVPVVVAGFILKVTGLSDAMRSITVIGWAMLVFGLILYAADQWGGQTKSQGDWSVRDAVIMGLWQALALIPGTSRSGAAISGARALGYNRHDGTRIAMLMSIPTIIASATLLGLEVAGEADWRLARDAAIAAAMSFVAALAALSVMMRLLRTVSFTPYVIYRVALGLFLLWLGYYGPDTL